MVATVAPGNTAQRVEIQRLVGTSWRSVSVRSLSGSGHATFALTRSGVYLNTAER